jgi:hypothetical protein
MSAACLGEAPFFGMGANPKTISDFKASGVPSIIIRSILGRVALRSPQPLSFIHVEYEGWSLFLPVRCDLRNVSDPERARLGNAGPAVRDLS